MQIHSVGIDLGKTTFHLVALRKDACGLEALTRFHFTALPQRLEIYPPRSAQEQQGRKNSHNTVPST